MKIIKIEQHGKESVALSVARFYNRSVIILLRYLSQASLRSNEEMKRDKLVDIIQANDVN